MPPGTTHQDRKEIIRHLVERVVVHVKKDSEYVDVTIHWHGGFTSQHEVVWSVQFYEQLRDFDKLMERIVELRDEGCTAALDCGLFEPGGIQPAEMLRRVLSRVGPQALDPSRTGQREDI